MPSTNGHGPKTAVLYARVSTDEQARSGFSLAQQMEALRGYANREGYQVLEEVADPGQSGASLERPGMDRVRDLVAEGGVSVVLAQDRDRLAREPAYHYLLKREFEEHGCLLRSLNDRGDGSPEGELTDGILDQLAKFERAKTAERSRRGKLRKAREGKIIAGRTPNYGFRFNSARDGYEVDEDTMPFVRRIFQMVSVDGESLYGVVHSLERLGVAGPRGGKWNKTQVRRVILGDVYKPHTFEQIRELVAPDVATRLNPEKNYGVWWFNRRRVKTSYVSELSDTGKRYRRRSDLQTKNQSEWIAVPVPDAGIPREVVDAARAVINSNRSPSNAGRRFWELSGGVLRCGVCGNAMPPQTAVRKSGRMYFYYRCSQGANSGRHSCTNTKCFRSEQIEQSVWDFTSELLAKPEQLRADLERMVELEREGVRGDPERQAKAWLDKLAETNRERRGYQRLAAKGCMTDEELDEALVELEETRAMARRELEALAGRRERLEQLELEKDALLENYVTLAPEALESLRPEERHRIYKMLRLKVIAGSDGSVEVNGAFGGALSVCELEPTQ
jgi:site-specific DNA recombinase